MNSDDKNIKKETGTDSEDDIVLEDIQDEENPAAALKKLREKLKVCVAEKQQYLEGWQRTKADYVNGKRQEKEEREKLLKYAEENLLQDIIPVLDNFDMAMGNKTAWETAPKNWRVGIEHIYSQFVKTLEEHNLKQKNPMGEKFDARFHDSIESVPTENSEDDHKVVEVLQKGYELNGKLIRPAKVKIGEFHQK